MMKYTLFFSAMALSAISAQAQTVVTDADLTNAYQTKSVSGRISCHDPSVFIDNITDPSNPLYYIYGSHLGRGYTTEAKNYQSWTSFKAGEEATNAENSLFANTSGTLINYSLAYRTHAINSVKDCNGNDATFGNFSASGWQYKGNTVKGNQWAPDVIYNKTMKKWCMYMSLNGDYWCSTICCFTSSSPQGPWIYQGPVVFSGFSGQFTHNNFNATDDWKNTDLAIATGETSLPSRYNVGVNSKGESHWGTYWPNCIDPCVFYDDNNNLWMSYGSWSGGIWMIKLNPENGLRDYTYKFPYEVNGTATTPGAPSAKCTSDPYFGKKIAGGYYVSGEASYIQKIGDYYFLFMSYGGLTSTGGYQMRVFRSQSPTGPYTDPSGKSAIFENYYMNYSATMTDFRGMLLMGGYKWDTMGGADICQGHNSAMIDLKDRAMVVYHTRFSNGGEGHQVRVHQLFLNQEGWICAAPYEFKGETVTNSAIASTASIPDADIPGDYQFIRHEYKQDTGNKAYETPVNVTLSADGKISGSATGTWSRQAGTDFITLTIGDVAYKGVIVNQTIDFTNIKALCIVANSGADGATTASRTGYTCHQEIWLSKADAKAAIKYTLDKITIPISDGATIATKPSLPTSGNLGANISWKSSDQSIMKDDGSIMGKGGITMTMTISKDGYQYSKVYNLTVDGKVTPTVVTYYPVSTNKNTTATWWTNFSTKNYSISAGNSMKFKFYNYSNKEAKYKNWCLYGANYPHGTSGYTEYFGIRCDNYDNTSKSNTGCSSNYNWDTFLSDMDGSLVDMTVTYSTDYKFTMSANIKTTGGTTYSYAYTKTLTAKPSVITLFFVNEGSYIDGSSLDPSTGVEIPIAYRPQSNDAIYSISGQRVSPDYKGVVIRNGHKYIQK